MQKYKEMSDFKSDALKIYLDSHTQLNQLVKLATVSIDYLSNSTDDEAELSNLINNLILSSGERWTPRIIKNCKLELERTKNDLIKSSMVWVYSAFDVYLSKVEGYLSEKIKNDNIETPEAEKEDRNVLLLYNKLNWNKSEVDKIYNIFRFYKEIRNCVAHNYGKPNKKLIDISISREFRDELDNWKTKFKNGQISPPPIVEDEEIMLQPHHSIFYSETCLRIAKDINLKMLETLGVEFYIEKIINKHLSQPAELSQPLCENVIKFVAYRLRQEYSIGVKDYSVIKNILDTPKYKILKIKYAKVKSIK